MITVYKYPFEIATQQIIELPRHALINHVGLDPNGQPCIWAEVDTDAPKTPYYLYVVGTGHKLPEFASIQLGTFIQGPFVWHVYSDVLRPT